MRDENLNALYLAMAQKYEKKDNIGDALSVPLLRAAVLDFLCYVLLHYAKPVTQREIALKLGISRSYVSRIEKGALEKIHELLTRQGLQMF